MRRLAAIVLLVPLALVLRASPAAAHASLESTSPAANEELDRSPPRVMLTFTERVTTTASSLRLFDSAGERLETGRVERDGRDVFVGTRALDDDVYVVTWRVVSLDAHPIHGAFTFQVGEPTTVTDTGALTRRLLAQQGGDTTTGFVYAVERALAFASLIALVGGVAFVAALWRDGRGDRRLRRLVVVAWVVAAVTALVGIGLHGAYAAALGLGSAVDPSVIGDELGTRFGRASLTRLALLAAAGAVLVAGARARRLSAPLVGTAALVGAGLLGTLSVAGHAASGDLVGAALPADVVHLAAVSVWLGGLAVLAVCRPPADVLPRFSQAAFVAVGVIVVTGVFQGWRQTRSVDALDGTTYGRLLLVKVGVFLVLVALAWSARRWVQRRRGAEGSFSRTIAMEVAAAAVVVVVTALLVNAQPGRTALAQPFATELEVGPLLVDVTVDPAKAGPADIHVYTLDRQGQVREVEEVTVALRLPARDVGPLAVPVQRAGPGHFAVYGFDLPFPGDWVLDVTARIGAVDLHRASTPVGIR